MPKYNKVKKSYDSDNNVSSDESEYLESSDESENIKTKIKKSKNKGKKDKDTDKKGKSVLSKKFLANQFPSKHANKVVKDEKKLKNKMILRSNEKKNKKNKKSSRVEELDEDVEEYYNDEVHVEEDDESEEYETDEEDSDEEDSDEEDSDEEDSDEEDSDEEDSDEEEYEEDSEEYVNQHEKDGIVNIVLALDGLEDDDEEYYEDDDAECNSEDEETFMKEKYEKINIKLNEKQKQKKEREIKKKENKLKKEEPTDAEVEYLDLVSTKKHYLHQLEKRPNSKTIKGLLDDINIRIKKLVKKTRSKNAKMYHKLVHKEKKRTNEIDYFKKKLSNKEQLKVMRDLKEINSHINIDKPYRLSLLDSDMPAKFKAIAMQKLNILKSMEQGDPEYYKIKNWVDTFMKIPFGMYNSLSVNIDDGIDKCHDFMENAKNRLDNCVYGLDDAKIQIMQFIGQWISNPTAIGSAIAIKGPMGTGKTTLVKEGISKILGREFAFITLGGTGDSSFLEGHSYTYEGSSWGKIVQILIDSKCMNPVIYFDELDKISDTPRGEEIVGILTHLTDTSQNNEFHDKYFSEIDFDLSKCLFIFSYNDEDKVNPILKDRMYRIQTKGYETKEKVIISKKYLLPKIRDQVNFKEEDVILPDETLEYIASNKELTKNESGVRNLKRCLEIIHTKLNLFRLVKSDTELFKKDIDMKVTFPFTVSIDHVNKLIKNDVHQNQSFLAMYV
jgi:ATP-dependent Lon protease